MCATCPCMLGQLVLASQLDSLLLGRSRVATCAASYLRLAAGVLPELLPLAALLGSVPEWERDAAGVSALILRALNAVAADYQQQGDAVSAAILLEAALRRCVGVRAVGSRQLAVAEQACLVECCRCSQL